MTTEHDSEPTNFSYAESTARAVTVQSIPRRLEMYSISRSEMDMIAAGNPTLHLSFLMFMLGTIVTVIVALTTVNLDDQARGLFTLALWISGVMAVYFACAYAHDWWMHRKHVRELLKRYPEVTN